MHPLNSYVARFKLLSAEVHTQMRSFLSKETNNNNEVNMESKFLLPKIFNIDSRHEVVSTQPLLKNYKKIVDPLYFLMYGATTLDETLSEDRARLAAIDGRLGDSAPRSIDYASILLRSDLSDFELDAGVYNYNLFNNGNETIFTNEKTVTQYLLYFERI